MFRKNANSPIFGVFGDYLMTYRRLLAENFSPDTSDIWSIKNINRIMHNRALQIFHNTEKFPFSPISL